MSDGVASNTHKQCGLGVEYVLKNALLRRTLDNVTVVMVAFNNFKRKACPKGEGTPHNQSEISVNYQSQGQTGKPASTRYNGFMSTKNENNPQAFKKSLVQQPESSSSLIANSQHGLG